MNRYTNETDRLYNVLEKHLSEGREYLVGNRYSLADIASFSWAVGHEWSGISVDDKPHVKAWIERIKARPAVQRGLSVPASYAEVLARMKDPELAKKAVEAAQKMMVGTQAAK
jgi:glutathione S-transferase